MLALQENPEYHTMYMVADLHAITTPYAIEELRKNRREVFVDYLAAGLDPEKSILFLQADVPQHTELAFYFSSVTTIAKMQHLPTFKDKVKQYPEHATMALLNYPVLMAADILIYKASLVPVGIDQEPHLEVAREIARRMNQEYGMDFPEPKSFSTTGSYVPSLAGVGKMSKSVAGSFINLTDSQEQIAAVLAGAPTDSGKGATVPTDGGVANLLKFVELFQGETRRQEYEAAYTTTGLRYGELKKELTAAIYKELQPIQAKRNKLIAKPGYVEELMQHGSEQARKKAAATVLEVRQKMGMD